MRPSPLPVAAALAGLALVVTGCSPTAAPGARDLPAVQVTEPVPSPSQVAPSASTGPAPASSPSVSSAPAAPVFRYDVAAVQRQLTAQKYYIGAIDGAPGPALSSAVMAFQKIQGIGADGTVGPLTLAALATPKSASLRGSAPANRVEVDLTRQVLYVVKGGAISRIMPVSSGNGATYLQKVGGTARSLTPVGYFTIERRILGAHKADLGILYDPQFFYRGWAIHGSDSVPARPASHGCVRVTRPDAKYLLKALSIGMSVYLYGGSQVFTAGSSAPGTDNPTGDTAADGPVQTNPTPTPTPPAPTPTRTASPSPSGSDAPTSSASPRASASPTTR